MNKGIVMKLKATNCMACIIIFCIIFLTGCKFSNNRFGDGDTDKEYDYRQMYLNNDTMDLTDKDLEAFNEATRIYNLYLKSCDTDYKKVIAAHDYIIRNCIYNVEGIENDSLTDDDFEPYGVFVKGKAVCEGYAKAFKMLMGIADIDCVLVTGNVGEDDIPHAWNMIKLDNSWYHVDVTYDDPNPETKEIVYLYLNVTDEVIERDHKWNKNNTPEAVDTKYDYIKNNKEIYNTQDEIIDVINKCNYENESYISFIWAGEGEIGEDVWKSALKGTEISNLSFSCLGVDGRRMYMVNLIY